jgi:hypothetical protein
MLDGGWGIVVRGQMGEVSWRRSISRNLGWCRFVAVIVQSTAVVTKPGGISWWAQISAIERVACGVGALLVSSGLVHVAVLLGTGASWDGPLSLCKAATFGLSFGLTLINIVWLLVFSGNPQAAYDTAGSLKPVHGVAMHGILVLPLLAYALSFVDWPEQRRLQIIRVASAAYVLVMVVVLAWPA